MKLISLHIIKIGQETFFSSNMFRLIEAGVTVLEKCKETTKIFEQEKVPTMPLVVERIYNMDKELEESSNDMENSEMARDFALELQRQMQHRFPDYGTDREMSCFGNYLNPSVKGVHLKISDKFESTKVNMEEKLEIWKREPEVETDNNPDEPEDVQEPRRKLSPTEQLKMEMKAKELGQGREAGGLGQGSSRGRGRGRGREQGRVAGSRVFEEPVTAFQRECR